MLVRLTRITGVDLRLFDFDYDLTWAAFFVSADEVVYGRYGGRDAKSAEARMSLAGLRHAMQAALDAHRTASAGKPADRKGPPVRVEDYPAAKMNIIRGQCIHCHQVNEFRRQQLRDAGRWRRDEVWVYPLPENVGLVLEVDRANRVRSVAAGSPAERAGLRAGDVIRAINGVPVASFADAQYGLHKAPARGKVAVAWQRDGQARSAMLELPEGWRKTNLTWRPSMLDILPALPVAGTDLEPAEKKALGLAPGKLGFRQEKPVHSQLRAAGMRENDVVIGIDNQFPGLTLEGFVGHVRRNYLVGDRITLHVLRGGKRLSLPLTLR